MNTSPVIHRISESLLIAITCTGLFTLLSTSAGASERYILHHFRDAVCKTFPCPNWSGVNLRTGEAIQFDGLTGPDFDSPASQARFDRQARAGGVLVEGDFTPMNNHANMNWSSAFNLKRFIRACEAAIDCRN